MSSSVSLRPIEDNDIDFLARVYATTRPDIEQTPLTDEQKQQIIQLQFEAQHAHYTSHFSDAQFDIILINGQPAGRVYVHRAGNEIRVLDITLLPEHRNQGIGSAMLNDLLDEARQASLPVRLWVENYNPSFRLFQRLGFKNVPDPEVDWDKECNQHLEWFPG